METEDGRTISMPIICDEKDNVAAVVMKKTDPETTILGKYLNAFGYPSLEKAQAAAKKALKSKREIGIAFYNLHKTRPECSKKSHKGDLIIAMVPVYSRTCRGK